MSMIKSGQKNTGESGSVWLEEWGSRPQCQKGMRNTNSQEDNENENSAAEIYSDYVVAMLGVTCC